MEQNKKRKKHWFIKFLFLVLIFCGILFYSSSFPVTMELLDERATEILSLFGTEKEIGVFSEISLSSKNIISKAEYWIEIFKENLEKTKDESKKVSEILITSAAEFPSKSGSVSSYFGKREDPFSKNEDFHEGIDIAAAFGSEVLAVWPGIICETGYDDIYGNYVVIEHSKDFFTKYCHLSKIDLKEKTFVNSGEKIGEAGSTGRSTGSHIHFEVSVCGRKIDPMECFEL